jgi:hypothetical protein
LTEQRKRASEAASLHSAWKQEKKNAQVFDSYFELQRVVEMTLRTLRGEDSLWDNSATLDAGSVGSKLSP